jgi:hypothetical protein
MTAPHEKLAQSLSVLKTLQDQGVIAIQSRHLSRTHRTRLTKHGFLKEVIKGWYIVSSYRDLPGESTAWYTSFWDFIGAYLSKRLKNDWCLSPEQSLSIHADNWTIPQQLLVRSSKANNNIIVFPHNTSILDVKCTMPAKTDVQIVKQLRVYAIVPALIACTPRFFIQNEVDIKTVLMTIRHSSEILPPLLKEGRSVIAGRLAGAFRAMGRDRIADDIVRAMRAIDCQVREENPFSDKSRIIVSSREKSPYVNRLRILWQTMRHDVLAYFPKAEPHKIDIQKYLQQVDARYVTDAYHSLSIEGYRVSPELIERVKTGKWNPDLYKDDREHVSAIAARGYWLAFQEVKKSIRKTLNGANPGKIFDTDHGRWYEQLFSPAVTAKILTAENLSGYRRHPVYIRNSMHVPPNFDALIDLMEMLCDLLSTEPEPAVRVVLGHFFFVYIHPYMDGNGRTARFLMNLMLAAGGYPWLIIPVESRDNYFASLEVASTRQDIKPFTQFLASIMSL